MSHSPPPHTTPEEKAARIKLMIFDVDGVLTDGSLHFGAEGEIIKTFHVLDGQGLRLIQNAGIQTAIISARSSAIVTKRANDLGITHVIQGSHNKYQAFQTLLQQCQFTPEQCGFIGDDIIDLSVLTQVGFAVSVPNAHHEVKKRVDYITQAQGGKGAVREICDFLLQAQNQYEVCIQSFINPHHFHQQ